MTKLTVLIGAGAVVDASTDCGRRVDTKTITEDALNNIKDDSANELINTIYKELETDYKRYNKVPNFEDLFHALEILKSAYTIDAGAPEYKPMYKYLMNIKEEYEKYNPYSNNLKTLNPLAYAVSFAQSSIIDAIQNSIESYSDKSVPEWYERCFKSLQENFDLDIFTLNYDTWFEHIFPEYNDGFYDANPKSQFLKFSPQKLLNSNSSVNIHHMHGQLDFRNIDMKEDPIKMFNDYELGTIYKIKNTDVTKRELESGCSDHTTQAGDHLKNCPIITGKMKIEKTIFPPLDAYRTNFNNCIVNNSNLLIIGYGFSDYYIDNLLSQFHNIHNENTRVNIIDFASAKHWRDTDAPFDLSGHKLHTIFGLCNDFGIEPNNLRRYSEIITLDNNHFHLYLKGFRDTVNQDLENIINSYQ